MAAKLQSCTNNLRSQNNRSILHICWVILQRNPIFGLREHVFDKPLLANAILHTHVLGTEQHLFHKSPLLIHTVGFFWDTITRVECL